MMKTSIHDKLLKASKEVNNNPVYFAEDLRNDKKLMAVLKEAEALWRQRVEEYAKKYPNNHGSCVSGAGIKTWILPSSRHKYPQSKFLFRAPNHYQGSLTWENSVEEILKIVREAGIYCWYASGMMH